VIEEKRLRDDEPRSFGLQTEPEDFERWRYQDFSNEPFVSLPRVLTRPNQEKRWGRSEDDRLEL